MWSVCQPKSENDYTECAAMGKNLNRRSFLGVAGAALTTGFLAVCALFLTMVAVPVGHNFVPSGRMGDVTWRPDASIGDTGPFRLGAGTGTLDLRDVDPADFTEPIVASVSFGNLTVVVPDDLTVRIEAGAGMGTVNKNGQDVGGVGVDEVVVVGDGPIDMDVEANVGFGQVLVEGNRR